MGRLRNSQLFRRIQSLFGGILGADPDPLLGKRIPVYGQDRVAISGGDLCDAYSVEAYDPGLTSTFPRSFHLARNWAGTWHADGFPEMGRQFVKPIMFIPDNIDGFKTEYEDFLSKGTGRPPGSDGDPYDRVGFFDNVLITSLEDNTLDSEGADVSGILRVYTSGTYQIPSVVSGAPTYTGTARTGDKILPVFLDKTVENVYQVPVSPPPADANDPKWKKLEHNAASLIQVFVDGRLQTPRSITQQHVVAGSKHITKISNVFRSGMGPNTPTEPIPPAPPILPAPYKQNGWLNGWYLAMQRMGDYRAYRVRIELDSTSYSSYVPTGQAIANSTGTLLVWSQRNPYMIPGNLNAILEPVDETDNVKSMWKNVTLKWDPVPPFYLTDAAVEYKVLHCILDDHNVDSAPYSIRTVTIYGSDSPDPHKNLEHDVETFLNGSTTAITGTEWNIELPNNDDINMFIVYAKVTMPNGIVITMDMSRPLVLQYPLIIDEYNETEGMYMPRFTGANLSIDTIDFAQYANPLENTIIEAVYPAWVRENHTWNRLSDTDKLIINKQIG